MDNNERGERKERVWKSGETQKRRGERKRHEERDYKKKELSAGDMGEGQYIKGKSDERKILRCSKLNYNYGRVRSTQVQLTS